MASTAEPARAPRLAERSRSCSDGCSRCVPERRRENASGWAGCAASCRATATSSAIEKARTGEKNAGWPSSCFSSVAVVLTSTLPARPMTSSSRTKQTTPWTCRTSRLTRRSPSATAAEDWVSSVALPAAAVHAQAAVLEDDPAVRGVALDDVDAGGTHGDVRQGGVRAAGPGDVTEDRPLGGRQLVENGVDRRARFSGHDNETSEAEEHDADQHGDHQDPRDDHRDRDGTTLGRRRRTGPRWDGPSGARCRSRAGPACG